MTAARNEILTPGSSDLQVIVVDDDTPARESLRWLLESVGRSVIEFGSAEQFLEEYPGGPGCLVLDVRMPGMSGLEAQRRVRERGWCLPVILVTGHGDVPMAVRAMREGAFDFFQKPYNDQLLLERAEQALQTARLLWQEKTAKDEIRNKYATLTRREKEISHKVCKGLSSKCIARELSLSSKTIEAYRANMMAKLEVGSIAELVQMILKLADEESLGS